MVNITELAWMFGDSLFGSKHIIYHLPVTTLEALQGLYLSEVIRVVSLEGSFFMLIFIFTQRCDSFIGRMSCPWHVLWNVSAI